MISKDKAIQKLQALIIKIEPLKAYNDESPEFKKWHRDVLVSIENIFGANTRHQSDFYEIEYDTSSNYWHMEDDEDENAYLDGLNKANAILSSMIDEISDFWAEEKDSINNQQEHKGNTQLNKVFIGHGRSPCWRELKDFIDGRLGLLWDEFNRVPVAGVTNIDRLAQMLDQASIAFLVMTAEDELADGNMHARMNVIHEVGLFQGRLGFKRAIVLLEEGCQEFSNIEGLGQIRFPKGNISAIFEDIRQVLERENII